MPDTKKEKRFLTTQAMLEWQYFPDLRRTPGITAP